MFWQLSSVANHKDVKGQPHSNLWKVLWVKYTKWFQVFLIRNFLLQIKRHSLLQIYMLRIYDMKICPNHIQPVSFDPTFVLFSFQNLWRSWGLNPGLPHAKRALYHWAKPPFSRVSGDAINEKCFYGHKSFFRYHSIDLVVFPCLQLIQIYLLWSGEYEQPQPNEVEWMEVQNLSGTHLEWWLKLYSSFTRCLHCIMIVAIRAFSYQSFQCFMVYQR